MAKKIEQLPSKLEDSIDSNVEDSMQNTAEDAQTIHRANDSVVSGELYFSIRHREVPHLGDGFSTHAASAMDRKAKFVEYGTGYRGEGRYKGPSGVPLENILTWIVEKGVEPYAYDTQYGLAVAIKEVIDEYGTRQHPFMRTSWEYNKPLVTQNAMNAIRKEVRRL